MEDKIRANAELVIKQLGPLSDLAFGYNAESVNECKESMADAIHLARRLGLEDKVVELEKKLEHYKNVFRHQMDF